MTVRTETALMPFGIEKPDCSQCGCIIIYSSKHCVLCDTALEIMHTVLSDFNLSSSIIKIVDVLEQGEDCASPPLIGLPTVKICQETITGLPDVDVARSAVMHAVLNGCFSDSKEEN